MGSGRGLAPIYAICLISFYFCMFFLVVNKTSCFWAGHQPAYALCREVALVESAWGTCGRLELRVGNPSFLASSFHHPPLNKTQRRRYTPRTVLLIPSTPLRIPTSTNGSYGIGKGPILEVCLGILSYRLRHFHPDVTCSIQ